MPNHSFFHPSASGSRRSALALTHFLLPGLLLGIWFSGSASDTFHSAMRAVVSSRVSIIGLLSSSVLPLLCSAFAVYIGQPRLLFPIAFCKAFSFSCLGFGLLQCWSSAGWLICALVLFSSACSMPVLCWYWLRHLSGHGFELLPLCAALGVLMVTGIVNYCLILPFLAAIITF